MAKRLNPRDPRRRPLLAKIHIAKKSLGLDDDTYRYIVFEISRGRTETAAELGLNELRDLVRHFKSLGWKEAPSNVQRKRAALVSEIRRRAPQHLGEHWEARLKGLGKKILGVDRLEWAKPQALRRLLAVMKSIEKQEVSHVG